MNYSFDANKRGGNELDDTRFIIGSVHIPCVDRLGESVIRYFVLLDEAPVKAVDRGSAVDEGLGDDVFVEGVFEDRQGNAE